MNDYKIAILITTFLRDKLLYKTIQSIINNYPKDCIILIADQGYTDSEKDITIEHDVLKEDSAGRLLGYVYVGDVFVNAQLLKNGYAIVDIVPPNKKYADLFISLQKEARKNRRGIWRFEDPNDEPYYIASKNIKKFHRPGCRIAKEISFDKRIIFRSKDDALAKGYSQDWRCNPLFICRRKSMGSRKNSSSL